MWVREFRHRFPRVRRLTRGFIPSPTSWARASRAVFHGFAAAVFHGFAVSRRFPRVRRLTRGFIPSPTSRVLAFGVKAHVRRRTLGGLYDLPVDRPKINHLTSVPILSTNAGSLAFCSISATIRLPTTAASACCQTSLTCSGVEIPNPTATGRSVNRRTRWTRFAAASDKLCWTPVTPARETALA